MTPANASPGKPAPPERRCWSGDDLRRLASETRARVSDGARAPRDRAGDPERISFRRGRRVSDEPRGDERNENERRRAEARRLNPKTRDAKNEKPRRMTKIKKAHLRDSRRERHGVFRAEPVRRGRRNLADGWL